MKIAAWVRPALFEPEPRTIEPEPPRSRRPGTARVAPSSLANPYRKETKKYDAFELYKKDGMREDLLEAIQSLGVTSSTAATWVYFFRKFLETGSRDRER